MKSEVTYLNILLKISLLAPNKCLRQFLFPKTFFLQFLFSSDCDQNCNCLSFIAQNIIKTSQIACIWLNENPVIAEEKSFAAYLEDSITIRRDCGLYPEYILGNPLECLEYLKSLIAEFIAYKKSSKITGKKLRLSLFYENAFAHYQKTVMYEAFGEEHFQTHINPIITFNNNLEDIHNLHDDFIFIPFLNDYILSYIHMDYTIP